MARRSVPLPWVNPPGPYSIMLLRVGHARARVLALSGTARGVNPRVTARLSMRISTVWLSDSAPRAILRPAWGGSTVMRCCQVLALLLARVSMGVKVLGSPSSAV